MSRWILGAVVVSIGLGGCERFSARSDIAAEVGSNQLKAERVATILSKSGGGPTLQAAEFVSNLWLDYALFAQATADGRIKGDSATIARILWPTISQTRVRIWHDTLVARRVPRSSAAADSAFNAGQNRVFQHIIVIPTGPTAADSVAAQKQIAEAAAKIKGGTPFGSLAAEISADGSKNDQGYLGFGPRGQFVKEFEDVAWTLEPGQVSGVVKTQFGFHLIRRPPLEEARSRIGTAINQRQTNAVDSIYVAELAKKHDMKVAGGAASAIKTAAADPDGLRGSTRTLVSINGGDLTVGDFVRWIGMFPLQVRMQLRNANDSVVTEYAKQLGNTTLLLRQADSAGVNLTLAQWQFLKLRYNQSIQQVQNELGLTVPELSDSSKLSVEQRSTLAAQKVEDFFTRLIAGQAQMQMVPPELSADLRAAKVGRVNQAGVARAVELATAQHRRDSATAAARGNTQVTPAPGVVTPAPGGPPIAVDSSKP